MMDATMDVVRDAAQADAVDPFVQASEVWVPKDGRLVLASGNFGALDGFRAASEAQSFAKGEGLPGKAWAEARPVVLKSFEGSYFRRTEAALAAGLTSAVAIPVFDRATLKAVLVVFCADDQVRTGAIEVWRETDKVLRLEDGYYGAAKQFEWVSQHTEFPRGQGLPGGVAASNTPMMLRDLGSGYRFVRAESAGLAGLTTGLGLPVPVPNEAGYVVTLLSAMGTPIARRFEIWDARSARMGSSKTAVLIDGTCAREGRLWDDETERRIAVWQGPLGRVLGSGVPVVESAAAGLPGGYASMVALPIHQAGELAHIVAWYC